MTVVNIIETGLLFLDTNTRLFRYNRAGSISGMLKKLVAVLLVLCDLQMNVQAAGAVIPKPDEVPQISEAPVGGEFQLYSSKGPVALSDFRGKVVLLYFGYTKCPDVCPTSLSIMTQALNGLSESELAGVQSIFISVDPLRDTYEALDEYADYFHSNLMGITGTPEQVADVASRYGARYYQVELEGSSFGYAVNHSSVIYLLSSQGVLRFLFPHGTPSPVVLEAIRYLLSGQ
jgi:protein SCO1/2